MIIKGWVTPRYLDNKWCKQFTVTLNKSKSTDIPVVISVNDKSFEGAFLNNEIPSYGDVVNANIEANEKLKECYSLIDDLNNYNQCEKHYDRAEEFLNNNDPIRLKEKLK